MEPAEQAHGYGANGFGVNYGFGLIRMEPCARMERVLPTD
jgi:hypothetical protein